VWTWTAGPMAPLQPLSDPQVGVGECGREVSVADGWMGGWMDGWMDAWMDAWMGVGVGVGG
jgi:hypothetical protein